MVLYRMQSSANNLAVDPGDMYSGKSSINRRKSGGGGGGGRGQHAALVNS